MNIQKNGTFSVTSDSGISTLNIERCRLTIKLNTTILISGIHYYDDDNWITRVPKGVLDIRKEEVQAVLLKRKRSINGLSLDRSNSDPSINSNVKKSPVEELKTFERTSSDPLLAAEILEDRVIQNKTNKSYHNSNTFSQFTRAFSKKKKGSPVKSSSKKGRTGDDHSSVEQSTSGHSKMSRTDSGFESEQWAKRKGLAPKAGTWAAKNKPKDIMSMMRHDESILSNESGSMSNPGSPGKKRRDRRRKERQRRKYDIWSKGKRWARSFMLDKHIDDDTISSCGGCSEGSDDIPFTGNYKSLSELAQQRQQPLLSKTDSGPRKWEDIDLESSYIDPMTIMSAPKSKPKIRYVKEKPDKMLSMDSVIRSTAASMLTTAFVHRKEQDDDHKVDMDPPYGKKAEAEEVLQRAESWRSLDPRIHEDPITDIDTWIQDGEVSYEDDFKISNLVSNGIYVDREMQTEGEYFSDESLQDMGLGDQTSGDQENGDQNSGDNSGSGDMDISAHLEYTVQQTHDQYYRDGDISATSKAPLADGPKMSFQSYRQAYLSRAGYIPTSSVAIQTEPMEAVMLTRVQSVKGVQTQGLQPRPHVEIGIAQLKSSQHLSPKQAQISSMKPGAKHTYMELVNYAPAEETYCRVCNTEHYPICSTDSPDRRSIGQSRVGSRRASRRGGARSPQGGTSRHRPGEHSEGSIPPTPPPRPDFMKQESEDNFPPSMPTSMAPTPRRRANTGGSRGEKPSRAPYAKPQRANPPTHRPGVHSTPIDIPRYVDRKTPQRPPRRRSQKEPRYMNVSELKLEELPPPLPPRLTRQGHKRSRSMYNSRKQPYSPASKLQSETGFNRSSSLLPNQKVDLKRSPAIRRGQVTGTGIVSDKSPMKKDRQAVNVVKQGPKAPGMVDSLVNGKRNVPIPPRLDLTKRDSFEDDILTVEVEESNKQINHGPGLVAPKIDIKIHPATPRMSPQKFAAELAEKLESKVNRVKPASPSNISVVLSNQVKSPHRQPIRAVQAQSPKQEVSKDNLPPNPPKSPQHVANPPETPGQQDHHGNEIQAIDEEEEGTFIRVGSVAERMKLFERPKVKGQDRASSRSLDHHMMGQPSKPLSVYKPSPLPVVTLTNGIAEDAEIIPKNVQPTASKQQQEIHNLDEKGQDKALDSTKETTIPVNKRLAWFEKPAEWVKVQKPEKTQDKIIPPSKILPEDSTKSEEIPEQQMNGHVELEEKSPEPTRKLTNIEKAEIAKENKFHQGWKLNPEKLIIPSVFH